MDMTMIEHDTKPEIARHADQLISAGIMRIGSAVASRHASDYATANSRITVDDVDEGAVLARVQATQQAALSAVAAVELAVAEAALRGHDAEQLSAALGSDRSTAEAMMMGSVHRWLDILAEEGERAVIGHDLDLVVECLTGKTTEKG